MEDTHGGNLWTVSRWLSGSVLILIIMEDTHGVCNENLKSKKKESLNPYYNGRYSWR